MPLPSIQLIRSEIKQNLAVSVSLVASQMIYASSAFIGTAFVARLGQDALAASILVTMVWLSLSVLFFGILNAVSVLISHSYGAKNHAAIGEILGQGVLSGIVLSTVVIVILLATPIFLQWSGQPPAVLLLAKQYIHAMTWTIPSLLLLITYEQFLVGIGRSKIVLRISLLVVPIEIPLIYALIFGKFGLPACGIAGIGYGFAITYTLTLIGLVIYLHRVKTYQSFELFSHLDHLRWEYLKEIFRIGLPMGFMHVIEVTTFAIITFFIARFGTTWLAAHQLVLQFSSFAVTLIFAMSQAVTVRVGHSVGAQDLMGVKYAAYVGMFLNAAIMTLVALGFCLLPKFFLRLDINIADPANAALVQKSAILFVINGITLWLDNFRIITFGALRGLKDTQFPLWTSFVTFWGLGVSSAYLFGFVWHFSAPGVWWGLGVGIGSAAIILALRLNYQLKHINLAILRG